MSLTWVDDLSDDDLLSISAYIIPSEVCKVAKLRVVSDAATRGADCPDDNGLMMIF